MKLPKTPDGRGVQVGEAKRNTYDEGDQTMKKKARPEFFLPEQ